MCKTFSNILFIPLKKFNVFLLFRKITDDLKHLYRHRSGGLSIDQKALLQDDLRMIDNTPCAKRAIRQDGYTSEDSVNEMTQLMIQEEQKAND